MSARGAERRFHNDCQSKTEPEAYSGELHDRGCDAHPALRKGNGMTAPAVVKLISEIEKDFK